VSDALATVIAVAVVVAIFATYGAPCLVAIVRRTPRIGTVFIINVLLGWTGIGWIVAFALALAPPNQQPRVADYIMPAVLAGAATVLFVIADVLWLHIPAA
jgi:Superinfection immunity protein